MDLGGHDCLYSVPSGSNLTVGMYTEGPALVNRMNREAEGHNPFINTLRFDFTSLRNQQSINQLLP